MATQLLRTGELVDVRKNLAEKLLSARKFTGMSTRAVAKKLEGHFTVSHASIANYEQGRSVPPMDLLAALSGIYGRPINWFLEQGHNLNGVRYRNLKSRVKVAALHRFEADVKRWIDAYVILERRLNRPLKPELKLHRRKKAIDPGDLARDVRSEIGIKDDDPVSSVIDVLERFGIRVIENPTDLSIDGMAAKYASEYVVVLNPNVSNDRSRLNAAHELGHVLLGDCDSPDAANKIAEQKAFDFASQFLLPNAQLKRGFEGTSMVRLVQFKERYGISLAAMLYRAEKLDFITKPVAKTLWIEFARRGWKTREPGQVRPDRATRFEQLIEEGLTANRMSMKEVADLAGVRTEAIRSRIDYALGFGDSIVQQDDRATIIPFSE